MLKRLAPFAAALLGGYASVAFGDAVLVYETTTADGTKTQQTLSIAGRWVRIDDTATGQASYILMDAGRMMMFHVNDPKQTYHVVRAGRLYWPSAPDKPTLRPTRKMLALEGVRCRRILETAADEPVAEHCMSGSGPLKLTAREMITLSRLFTSARRTGLGWPSVATPDERQVSIRSRRLGDKVVQVLKSVAHKVIPREQLKIPDVYTRVEPESPRTSGRREPPAQSPSKSGSVPAEPPETSPQNRDTHPPEQTNTPLPAGPPQQSAADAGKAPQ